MGWGVESGSFEGVVVKFGSQWVLGNGCDRCNLDVSARGRISRCLHGVEMGCEDFDDVCGIVIVVREVYVDVEATAVLGVG